MPAAAPVSAVFSILRSFYSSCVLSFLANSLYGFFISLRGSLFLAHFSLAFLHYVFPCGAFDFFLQILCRAFAFIFFSGFFFCLLPRSAAGTRTRKHKNSEHLCCGAHSAGFDESFFLNFRSVPRMCIFGRRIFFAVREKMGRPLKKRRARRDFLLRGRGGS